MNITQRIIDVRAAIAHAQGALSVANDDLSALLAHAVGLEQRIAHALSILDPLYDLMVEEGYGERADMLYEGAQKLRGMPSVARMDRGRAA
jgi:hypothetical protein